MMTNLNILFSTRFLRIQDRYFSLFFSFQDRF